MSLPLDTGLHLVRQLLAEDLHLAVAITTSRGSADHRVSVVVNAAVIDHSPVAQ